MNWSPANDLSIITRLIFQLLINQRCSGTDYPWNCLTYGDQTTVGETKHFVFKTPKHHNINIPGKKKKSQSGYFSATSEPLLYLILHIAFTFGITADKRDSIQENRLDL